MRGLWKDRRLVKQKKSTAPVFRMQAYLHSELINAERGRLYWTNQYVSKFGGDTLAFCSQLAA